MNELATQWYQAGSLCIQAGFLIAAVWCARAILKGVRAWQEQMGALLRLTVGGTHTDETAREGGRPTPYLLDGWPEAAQQLTTEAAIGNLQTEHRSIFAGLVEWLQRPMASSDLGAWRRMMRWLQTPAGG